MREFFAWLAKDQTKIWRGKSTSGELSPSLLEGIRLITEPHQSVNLDKALRNSQMDQRARMTPTLYYTNVLLNYLSG